MNLTTHLILSKQNQFLSQALESLSHLKTRLLVADLGADKDSLGLCRIHKAQLKKYPWRKNFSEVRNLMAADSATDWNFYVEPWEVLTAGGEYLAAVTEGEPAACRLLVLSGDSIRKEVRLWNRRLGCRFVNPVYETLDVRDAVWCEGVLWENKVDRGAEVKEILGLWEKGEPLSQDVRYFKSLQALAAGDHQTFCRVAKQYLFQEQKQPVAYSMLTYYLGLVNCMVHSDLGEATRNAVACIAAHPLMAEYWCLLGDVLFKARDLGRAEHFYENAKLLGSRRLCNDPWPMHVSKYEEYPTAMIEKCRRLRKEVVTFRRPGSTH